MADEVSPPPLRFGARFRAAWLAYNVLVQALFALLWLPALAAREFRGRFGSRLGFRLPRPRGCIWLHAPSVGEALAIRAFVAELRAAYPGRAIVLTTFTAGGRHVAKHVRADHHLALPYDLYPSVVATIHALRPSLFLVVEGDYWPNLMYELLKRRVPIAVVNGRFTAKALRNYRRTAWLFRPLFRGLSAVCAAEVEYVARYEEMGVDRGRVVVTGNLKYDNHEVAALDDVVELVAAALGKPDRRDVLLAASTHAGEEELAAAAFLELRRANPRLKIYVAPRYPERAAGVAALLESRGIKTTLRSFLPRPGTFDAVVLDTLGELGGLYPLGAAAVIGGSFVPRGGQNMMEAAYHGCVSVWGPHVENFPAEVKRLEGRGGVGVADAGELARVLRELYANADVMTVLGEEAAATAREMMGASRRTIAALARLAGKAAA